MAIDRDQVLHVARLARLDLDDASVDTLVTQLGQILDYVEALNRIDTEGVKPTSHAISLTNALREDRERPHLDRHSALENAPERDDDTFLVPKVIG
ncbi:MAG: Asp-tRNA(Asn)/Glu-tRNA(Gln) amidotransferase subunit GatC [Desulfobacterales bacterium]|jgi:aspartyl-tRNA(Asn)/glutamyl-tRNA(Gln) amidotransferase subunit C